MAQSVWSLLLIWYRKHGRDLPWRGTRDPYRILLSEIMLQQTQVARVRQYYGRWLELFPNWSALATASQSDVIRAWAGLGYNRRALSLREIAIGVVKHGEPKDYEGWLALKGIGPYTAAALALFAHGQRVMPIDTNIRRVLGRVYLKQLFPQLKDDERLREAIGSDWHRARGYRDVPQALFDLANTHCFKQPQCGACPLRAHCASAKRFLSGTVTIPRRTVLKARETIKPGKRYPDRIYRGRILEEVREAKHGVSLRQLGERIDSGYKPESDFGWVEAMVTRMVRDGLVRRTDKKVFLPRE